ncbi:MAG: efflux RND transporter permease subunit [Armatimonadetes bacterium]|nr:efflux RND transporter permease subunit [Armatimonadota bacterium]
MFLTNLSIKRPIAILMLVAALMVLGWRSMQDMGAELNPSTNIPFVTITTVYPGAGPEEVETLISKPLEDAVASVNGIKSITSINQEGVSNVALEFYLGIDPDVAASDVRQKVDAALGELPRDAESPVIAKLDLNAQPVLTYSLSSEQLNNRELRDLAENVLQYRLAQVRGVGQVNIFGGEVREIQVKVDKDRLKAYGLTIQDVVNAVQSQNLNLPGGRLGEGDRDYSIRTLGEYASVQELRSLRISVPGRGLGGPARQINLSDVSTVTDASAERDRFARVNGKESVTLIISKLADANTVQMADGVKKAIAEMEKAHENVNFVELRDESRMVRAALHDVNISLILGSLLAVLVVFLFLHDLRGTFIVALAIPTSLVATFIPMKLFGFTLNQMTMLGLSLVVGVLVDDSIVVIENIYRHLARGETPREAALNGRSEIGLAAMTITLVDVVVFVPIGFMGGIVGQFFRQFGITVAASVLFSLLISFTFTPMLASRWYRTGEDLEHGKRGLFRLLERGLQGLDNVYRRLLHFVLGRGSRFNLGRRLMVVFLGYGLLVFSMFVLGPRLRFQFAPVIDSGQVIATIELPAGASLEESSRISRRVEQIMDQVPEKKNIFSTVGYISGGIRGAADQGRHVASVQLNLKDKENLMDRLLGHDGKRTRSDRAIAQEIRPEINRIPGAQITVGTMRGWGGGAPIQMTLSGTDLDRLQTVAEQFRDRMAKVPGVLDPDISLRPGKPEVQVRLDRVRAADSGVNVRDAALAVRNAFAGNTDAKFRDRGEEYDIRVQYEDFDRRNPADVGQVLVPTSSGQPVDLRSIAHLSAGQGPTKIERKNRMRLVTVSANLAPGYATGNVQQAIDQAVEGVDTSGVTVGYGGEVQSQQEEFPFLMGALMLGGILVYMLMATLFNSLLHPFTIMLSLPMALIGALAALVIADEALSIIAMIGFIMLMGLVTKNAILLIDYTNTLRARGWERDDAIEEAGPTRLRPILMTTIAMIFGMLPIALRIGEASEMRAPLAIAVIGGLILSTLLTLVVIPVTYTLFDDIQRKLTRKPYKPTRTPPLTPVGEWTGNGHGVHPAIGGELPEEEKEEERIR